MNEKLKEKIDGMINSENADDVSAGIFLAGQNNLHEFDGLLWSWVEHKNDHIRNAVRMVLGHYWQLPEFEPILDRLIEVETDTVLKLGAIRLWFAYYKQTQNLRVIKRLLKFIENPGCSILIRSDALRGVYSVLGIDEPIFKIDSYQNVNITDLAVFEKNDNLNEIFNTLVPWAVIRELELK